LYSSEPVLVYCADFPRAKDLNGIYLVLEYNFSPDNEEDNGTDDEENNNNRHEED